MSVFDRLARESEAERQEWARRNAQTSSESTARVQQELGRASVFDRLEKESEAERQEWARRNAQTAGESTGRVQQEMARTSVFDRLEKESEAERKEWARRNAQTALESSQRAGTDYARASGMEPAPAHASPAAHSAPAPKPAPANGPPNFAATAESVKVIMATCRDRFHDDVNKIVKNLTRDTNEELMRAFGRARTTFSVSMDDLAESVTSQAMNFCKNNANADRAKWAQTLKSFRAYMQGAPSDVNGIQTKLLTIPEWSKTPDLLVPALHRHIDASFQAVSDPLAEAISKISA